MKHWGLGDGKHDIGTFGSWDELEKQLRDLEASSTIAKVFTLGPVDKEHSVEFGLSPEACFLEFHPSVGASTNYIAHESCQQSNNTCWFDYAGTPTEIPLAMCISHQTLSKALREYVETGTQPSCVDWLES